MYRRFFDLDPGPIGLTFGLQLPSPEQVDSIEIPRSRSNSGSDGIFSRHTLAIQRGSFPESQMTRHRALS
jgi:hypothetical protein